MGYFKYSHNNRKMNNFRGLYYYYFHMMCENTTKNITSCNDNETINCGLTRNSIWYKCNKLWMRRFRSRSKQLNSVDRAIYPMTTLNSLRY